MSIESWARQYLVEKQGAEVKMIDAARHYGREQRNSYSAPRGDMVKRFRKRLSTCGYPCGVNGNKTRFVINGYALRSLSTAKPTTKRACMCCRRSFKSEGNHNRLCYICRQEPATPITIWAPDRWGKNGDGK